MEIVCIYCGVVHPGSQSFCDGCGGALPASGAPLGNDAPVAWQSRKLVGAAIGLAILVVAVVVISNRLSGPQQIEIVNSAAQEPIATLASASSPSGAEQHRYVKTAQFTSAYVAISQLRMMLNQYVMSEGDYPDNFAAMGIDPSELSDGQYVTAVTLEPGGVLVGHLDSKLFGDNAVLKLTPKDVMGGTQTRWDCSTSVPDDARVSNPGGMRCPFDPELAR